ncbi:MAG: hypothetical protein KAW56_00700 [Candidatus Marinimicrobia bacterium]|nr:hypothetical protein [Candidatus Neomarinimicrobiota bacterium]MCK4445580.1 hypothetical protein [Candidatus Neomarinimicrobiota bacterium]
MKSEILKKIGSFFRRFWKVIIIWIAILIFIELGIHLGMDKKIIAVLAVVFGILSHAFAGLMAIIALVPVIGPLIIRVLSLPVFWLLNAVGYYVSVIAIKKGYSKNVINYRVITIIFLVGFTVGFLIAKLI